MFLRKFKDSTINFFYLKFSRIPFTKFMMFHHMPSMVGGILWHWFQVMALVQKWSQQCRTYLGTNICVIVCSVVHVITRGWFMCIVRKSTQFLYKTANVWLPADRFGCQTCVVSSVILICCPFILTALRFKLRCQPLY